MKKSREEATAVAEPRQSENPKCLPIFAEGVRTAKDFASGMSALMGDLASNRINPNIGNAICNAGGKLLKAVEMQQRYGTQGEGGGGKTLELIGN